MKILILLLPLFLFSCTSENEEKMIKDCDGLAMLYYRGLPVPSKLYKKHCQEKEKSLEYNPEKCKRAMGDLMMNGSETRLKKMFGGRIMECFNKVDLERFIK